MTTATELAKLTIYHPDHKAWGHITGACLEEEKPRLVWVSHDSKHFSLLAFDTVETLIKTFSAPF